MSDREISNSKLERPTGARRSTRHGFFGGLFMGGLLGALLAVTVGAFAQFGGARSAHFRSHDPELTMERAELAIEMVLGRVDATEAQQEQVKSLVQSALDDLQQMLAEAGSTHDAVQEILTQPYVDRAALEQLRTTRLQQADVASQRVVGALADAAEVLTQEQRVELMALRGRFGH